MTTFSRFGSGFVAAAAALVLSVSSAHAALYMSVVAETHGPDAANFVPSQGRPVTYAAVDGGYINSGDPVGGIRPAPAALVESAIAEALGRRGFEPAAPGTTPAVLLVYNWGEIRHDSFQVRPTDHLKGNDRARLLLVARDADARRIESDLVNDRYFDLKVGAMTRTERDRETIQLAHDDMCFVVVSAYDAAALRQNNRKLVWQAKLTTRAIGHSMSEAVVSLINYGAPYFGQNHEDRIDLKKGVIEPGAVRPLSPVPGLDTLPRDFAPDLVRNIVQTEHNVWSGKFPNS